MTFQQYIDNPMGKQSAVFSQKDIYKAKYTETFDALYMREAGKLTYFLYYDDKKDIYFAHLKIPSEELHHFYYDVVIKFSTDNNALRVSDSLKEYDVRFFSNDPAFVFTYGFTFHKNNMLVEECKSKLSKIVLKQSPDIRNPYGIPGYVKSIYFAYLFMSRLNMFSKNTYKATGKRYSNMVMLNNIDHCDKKLTDRQIAAEEAKKEIKKEKAKKFTSKDVDKAYAKEGKKLGIIDKINPIKKVGKIGSIKSIKKK